MCDQVKLMVQVFSKYYYYCVGYVRRCHVHIADSGTDTTGQVSTSGTAALRETEGSGEPGEAETEAYWDDDTVQTPASAWHHDRSHWPLQGRAASERSQQDQSVPEEEYGEHRVEHENNCYYFDAIFGS